MSPPSTLSIDPEAWYSPREAMEFLDGKVTSPETLKAYCRKGRVEAKRVGPKNEWQIRGAAILKLRQEWNLDP